MLTGRGAKLLDLGVSKRLSAADHHGDRQHDSTRVDTLRHCQRDHPVHGAGAARFIRPTSAPTSSRSCAALYEMLTGRRAFRGDSEARVIASIMSENPPRASSLEPSVPPALDAVIERCLRKTAETRYQTCAELLAALSQVGPAPAVADSPVSQPLAEPGMPQKRRRRRLVINFSIGISFGVLLLAVVLPRRGEQPATAVTSHQAAATPSSVPVARLTLPRRPRCANSPSPGPLAERLSPPAESSAAHSAHGAR